jgi:hypothetical protein
MAPLEATEGLFGDLTGTADGQREESVGKTDRMSNVRSNLRALAILCVLSTGSPAWAGGAEQSGGDVERGREFYRTYGCYQCHLYSGAGYRGAPGGARIVPMELTREAFTNYLRNPRMPRFMPPYTTAVLPDLEARDIYAYLRSLPVPPEAEDLPLLRDIIEEQ